MLYALAGAELGEVRIVKLVDDDGGIEDSIRALLEDQRYVALGGKNVA